MPKTGTVNNKKLSLALPSDQIALVQSIFEVSPDAVQLDDMQERVIFANGAWLSLFHVDAVDVLGAKWPVLVKDRPCKGENLTRSWSQCKKGTPSRGTVALKTDGTGRQQVSYTRMPLRGDDGEVRAVLSIFRLEKLEPGDEEIAQAAHDLNNVFTAIIAGAQLIERQNHDIPGLISKADLIQRSAQRGIQLLRKIVAGAAGTEQ